MAATILEQGKVCDGYDVIVSRNGGHAEVVHLLSQPADVQAVVDAWDAATTAREAAVAAEAAAASAAQAEADSWTIGEA